MGMIERKKSILLNEPHLETVQSGNTSDSAQIAAFRTDMKIPMKSLKVYFSPIQEGSGDPSPDNVRPISGHTGLTIKRAGVNLLRCDTFTNGNSQNVKMVGTRNSDGEIESISLTGTCTGPNVFRNVTYTPNVFKIMDGTYATSAYSNQANIWLGTTSYNYKDQDGHRTSDTEGAGWKIFEVGEVSGVTRTYTLARIQGYPYATGVVYDTIVYPMMCLSQDQGCEFEPYKGIEIPISWQSEAGTLYGGYVDSISGELVKEWANISSYNGELLPGEWMSSKDVYSPGTLPTAGAQVVYKLSTPTTYQLTPQQIKALIGRNNIWSDAGDVEVQYWKH